MSNLKKNDDDFEEHPYIADPEDTNLNNPDIADPEDTNLNKPNVDEVNLPDEPYKVRVI